MNPLVPLSEPEKLAVAGVLQLAKWISYFILTGAGLAATVCALRLTKQTDFTVGQVKLKLSYFPYVVAALTLIHLFLTWGFTQEVSSIRSLGPNVSTFAWNSLIQSDAFVFNGMWPRVWHPTSSSWLSGMYMAQSLDRAFWAALAFAVITELGVTLSLVSLREKLFAPSVRTLELLSLGSALALLNWIIGTRWAVAASSLLR